MKNKYPKEFLIAITYRCNARCHMCNIWQYPTKESDEIRPKDLESLPRMDFCNITGGEPFLRADIADFVKVLEKKAKRIVISTNGFFTDRVTALAAKYPRIGVRVSIEGLPQTNDELRGLPNGFNNGLRTLLELRRIGLKDIGFGITLSDRNIHDLVPLYELSKSMGLEFATAVTHNNFYFHKFDNRIALQEDFKKEFRKLIADLLREKKVKSWFRGYFNYGLLNYVQGKKRLLPCAAAMKLLFIAPQGDIFACNGLEKTMGNIKERPFREIWASREAEAVRRAVAGCDKECWMIGSVAPAMKENLLPPALWVMKSKLRTMMGKDVEY